MNELSDYFVGMKIKNQTTTTMAQSDRNKFGFGAILILVGSYFLLRNLDLLPTGFSQYLFSWQGIMIIIGAILLATKPDKATGLILITVGIFFLFPEIWYIPGFNMRTWWPVLLIVVGILLLTGYQNRGRINSKDHNEKKELDQDQENPKSSKKRIDSFIL